MCEHARQLGGRTGFVCLDCGADVAAPAVPLTWLQRTYLAELVTHDPTGLNHWKQALVRELVGTPDARHGRIESQ